VATGKTDTANPVIYGEDTRIDIQQSTLDPMAAATAMFVDNYKLAMPFKTLKDFYPLCADEPFQDQPLLGFCSGVLIAPNQVLTAGHCFDQRKKGCENVSVLFGFTSDKVGKTKKTELYTCQEILKLENTFGSTGKDYAIIRLDRAVKGVTPVRIASEIFENETVFSYSYPLGMPLKKDQAVLRTSENFKNFIHADVDTFDSSSGSPLFNSKGEVVGLLSRGAEDILEDDIMRIQQEGGCLNFHRCDRGGYCPGERFFKANLVPQN